MPAAPLATAMHEYRFYTCDVFTDRPFAGNPLAVLTDARGLDAATMQAIAREFAFSETAFVLPPRDPRHTAHVRIFTPGGELPFAGHPTLGTAYVLGSIGFAPGASELVFEEGVGPVRVQIERDRGRIVRCTLTTAQLPQRTVTRLSARSLASMVGLSEADLDGPAEVWSCGVPFLIVPLRTVDALARAQLDIARWRKTLAAAPSQKVYLAAAEDPQRWRVRMFAPGVGVAEDAATGSAAAAFAGWRVSQASTADGTHRWTLQQGQEIGRPSTLVVEADIAAGRVTAVRVAGSAVMMTDGTLRL